MNIDKEYNVRCDKCMERKKINGADEDGKVCGKGKLLL